MIVIILSLRIPAVQQKITDYATSFVSDKTNTKVNIDKLYISFLGEAVIEGIYVEDQQNDTLLYSQSILVDVAWRPAISGNIIVKNFELEGLKANVYNTAQDSTFNYQFIIDAFASDSTNSTNDKTTQSADSTKNNSGTTFKVKKLNISDINLSYKDAIIGLNTDLNLKELNVSLDEFDLDSLRFAIDEFNLSGVALNYSQKNAFPETEEKDEEPGRLPVISLKSFQLQDIEINYATLFDSTDINGVWKNLRIEDSKVDLNTNDIDVANFIYEQPLLSVQLAGAKPSSADTITTDKANQAFEWPDWNIKVNQFDFSLADFEFHQGEKPAGSVSNKSFNASHLIYQDFHLNLEQLAYAPDKLNLEKIKLSVQDSNVFKLKELSAAIKLNKDRIAINGLVLKTGQSALETSLNLQFESFDSLIAGNLNQTDIDLKLGLGTKLDLRDAYYFAPELKSDSNYLMLARYPVKIYGNLKGDVNKTYINQLKLFYGNHFNLALEGYAENWMSPDDLSVVLNSIRLNAKSSDFVGFIPETYPEHYPQNIKLNGQASWKKGKAIADLKAQLDKFTKLDIRGNFNTNSPETYDLNLNAKDLALDKWLQDTAAFEPTDLILEVKGKGLDLYTMETRVDLKLPNFHYLDNDFKPIAINAELINQKFLLQTGYNNDVLDFNLDASGTIDSIEQDIQLKTEIKRLNLLAFGIADSLSFLQMDLLANLNVKENDQMADLHISNFSFGTENDSYPFDDLVFNLFNSSDSSMLNLNWEQIAFNMHMNKALQSLSELNLNMTSLLALEFFDQDSLANDLSFDFKLGAALSTNLERFIPLDLYFDPISLEGDFSEKEEHVEVHLNLPFLHFQEIDIDSLEVNIISDANELESETKIKRITSDLFNIYPTLFRANINEEKALFKLFMEDENADSLFYINATANNSNDSLNWNIVSENLILNGKPWNMNKQNKITYKSGVPVINNLIFERNQQTFGIHTENRNDTTTALVLNFQNFRLGNFFAIIDAEESPIKGKLDGDIKLLDIKNPLELNAAFAINDLIIMEEEAGDLNIKVSPEKNNRYAYQLGFEGPIQIESNGWFDSSGDTLYYDSKTDIKKISLPFITSFAKDFVKEAEGSLSGKFNVNNTNQNKIDYSGNLKFSEASIVLASLNNKLRLPSETILIEKEEISLENFTLIDEQGQKMRLNGTVGIANFNNPDINFDLKAKNFQLLNSQKSDNELFFGKVFADLDIKWEGKLDAAKVSAEVRINENTDFTYIIPEAEADLVESEGIVEFKSPYEPSDSAVFDSTSASSNVALSGIDLRARILTDKNAAFKIIVDERRGDYLTIKGETNLNFQLRKNGTTSLTGNYEVNSGHYQLSLYDLVKRKFEIRQGSRISWSGDPTGADLNITALYNVETAVSSLMEDQTANANQTVKTQYRQSLPFIVQLFVKGSITKPEISFGLDMPESARGALGGNVYQQVQAINSNESRLNKQVFSLLVLNQFFPAGSDSGGPSSESVARNSASQILSNQLNQLSGKYVKGVDLNLGVNSYENYESGTPENRTELDVSLSKSMFNDRVRVKVGSQVDLEGEQRQTQGASEVLGNVLVEYLLTEDGRFMLTAFRKNEWEGFLDGQVIITGASVKFTREFNELKELWKKKEEVEQNTEQEDKDEKKEND